MKKNDKKCAVFGQFWGLWLIASKKGAKKGSFLVTFLSQAGQWGKEMWFEQWKKWKKWKKKNKKKVKKSKNTKLKKVKKSEKRRVMSIGKFNGLRKCQKVAKKWKNVKNTKKVKKVKKTWKNSKKRRKKKIIFFVRFLWETKKAPKSVGALVSWFCLKKGWKKDEKWWEKMKKMTVFCEKTRKKSTEVCLQTGVVGVKKRGSHRKGKKMVQKTSKKKGSLDRGGDPKTPWKWAGFWRGWLPVRRKMRKKMKKNEF